jgi:phospholipase C
VSFCGTIIREITWLERQAQEVISKICTIEAVEDCADWKDEGYDKCVESRDEGYNSCTESRDEGYNQCCDWWPCSWVCDAVVWISNVICVVWTWVSNIVCVVWNWISKWVCRLFHWIYTTICKLIVSIIFWFIRRVLLWIIFIPCKFHTPGLDDRIKHIFVLVLENRSFDHMLGATPIAGTDPANGGYTQTSRRPDGATNDWVDASGVTHSCPVDTGQKRSVGVDPGHEFGDTLVMLCGAAAATSYPPYPPIDNSGFAENFAEHWNPTSAAHDPCTIMKSYTDQDVPVITALAREFAVCDHWFSSMPGPTWPNRYFFHAASSAGLDDSPSGFDSGVAELLSGLLFDNGTIYDLLDSENIDWAVYHGDAFPQVMSLSGMDITTMATHFHDMDDFEEDLGDGSIANFVFIEPDYGDDITGNSYKCGNSQHPVDDITHGERLIKRVYEAIRNSPVWNESMLIVTYDEGGGFYDHERPGATVHPGDSITDPVNNFNNFDFTQLGVRVPAIVCSPWIPRPVVEHREGKGGRGPGPVIDHRIYEHASVPATVERLWGLPNMTDRDKHAQDLTHLLSLSSPRTDAPTTLPPAAAPESDCDEDKGATGRSASGLTAARLPQATLLDPVELAHARQQNPAAITSTAGAFFAIAVRRDLMLAPRDERDAIFAQARRFRTMGEVGLYAQKVIAEIQRGPQKQKHQARPRRTAPL